MTQGLDNPATQATCRMWRRIGRKQVGGGAEGGGGGGEGGGGGGQPGDAAMDLIRYL